MAIGAMGGCDPVVFELAGRLFAGGSGSPEFAGTPEGGGAFVWRAAGIGEADEAVLWRMGGAICGVCRRRASGDAGGDGDAVSDVGGG